MIAAVHFENFLFLLFIAIAFFFQLLTRAATKSNKDSNQPEPRSPDAPPPLPRATPQTDEERVRKFLEALGQPPGSTPPPPVRPRPTYQKPVLLPRVGPFQSPLPPLTTEPPELPRPPVRPSQPASVPQGKLFVPKAPVFEVNETLMPVEAAPAIVPAIAQPVVQTDQAQFVRPLDKLDLASLLKSPTGLRDAVVLREIFGPPRAFSDSTI